MIALVPLCTMTLTLRDPVDAGNTPTGQCMIAEIASASLSGAPGRQSDRRQQRRLAHQNPGGLGLPGVRIAFRTNDDAVVLMRYPGRVRLVPGKASITLIAPVFETGDRDTSGSTRYKRSAKVSCPPTGQDSTTKSTNSDKPGASATAVSPCAELRIGAP